MTTTAKAVTSDVPMSDVMNSMTGFEELAIEGKYGASVYQLFSTNLVTAMRAVAFIVHKRTGKNDKDAYTAAMNMPMSELDVFFPDDVDEPLPDEPTTETGKGDSAND